MKKYLILIIPMFLIILAGNCASAMIAKHNALQDVTNSICSKADAEAWKRAESTKKLPQLEESAASLSHACTEVRSETGKNYTRSML